ncbi:mildew resistance protein [Cucumis melo var. makuwa]|uniref:Mildew resistance protein n=1 Tax=Cucumis melo var. makuwa TaxID=1194695 RepID=A0A5A7SVY6_CUCMM|nr:mildew resistance protein [Cucumis melo var. makuwa]TYK21568.1 mildew resistance protein [Cucumis melo var. makuwa]
MGEEGRLLAITPTRAFATVVTLMVSLGFFFQGTLKQTKRRKRKSLLAALEKIKEELMLFGLLSLLMGHWIVFVTDLKRVRHIFIATQGLNDSIPREHNNDGIQEYCPEVLLIACLMRAHHIGFFKAVKRPFLDTWGENFPISDPDWDLVIASGILLSLMFSLLSITIALHLKFSLALAIIELLILKRLTKLHIQIDPTSEGKLEFDSVKVFAYIVLAISALALDNNILRIPLRIFSYAATLLGGSSHALGDNMDQSTIFAYLLPNSKHIGLSDLGFNSERVMLNYTW